MANQSRPPAGHDALPWWMLGGVGVLLLSYPWLAPFLQERVVGGVPLFFLYTFGTWAALIAAAARMRAGP